MKIAFNLENADMLCSLSKIIDKVTTDRHEIFSHNDYPTTYDKEFFLFKTKANVKINRFS